LRAYFNDELFVMQQRRLVPTPRAEALAPAVREALLQIQLSVIAWDPLVPAESDRCFRIVLSDFMTLVFFEKVIKRVAREAPGVSFELLHMIDYPDERLHGGDVDFLILPKQFMSAPHPSAKLFGEKLVCVGCPNNQQLHGKLSLERFMSLGHVATMFGRTLKPSVEQWLLLEHGFKRRIEIVVQGFNAIPILLQGTNRISTLPLRLVRHFEPTIPLQIVDHPLPPLSFTEAIQWPLLHNSDPGNIWMRNIILEEASRIEASVEGDFQKARAM
jgi:LysR family nod box-dependent transcriptional activator